MLRFFARGIVGAIVTILMVSIVVTLLIEAMPGDRATVIAGEYATPEQVDAVRDQLGLDRNIVARWFDFAANAVSGDLGESIQVSRSRPVVDLILPAIPATASLTILAFLIALLIALPIGYAAASRPGSFVDRGLSGASSVLLAVPTFVLALLLIGPLAVNRSIFPALGYVPLSENPGEWLRHMILPAVSLAGVCAAELARQIRGSLIDTFEQDYLRTAEAKGMSRSVVIVKHAFKNAAGPLITVAGLQLSRLIGGVVVVERVFNLPGLGSLGYTAVTVRDVPVIQGVVLACAVFVILINLLVDLTYGYLNPKLRT